MAGIYFSNLRYHEIMDDEYSRGGGYIEKRSIMVGLFNSLFLTSF